jgi:hypothetical protein
MELEENREAKVQRFVTIAKEIYDESLERIGSSNFNTGGR